MYQNTLIHNIYPRIMTKVIVSATVGMSARVEEMSAAVAKMSVTVGETSATVGKLNML